MQSALRPLFKMLSFYWLIRAIARGPRGFAAYLIRRQLRRATNRQIRRVR